MKNKDNKTAAILYFFGALCFYFAALLAFINENSRMGTIYLCLGSAFLCFGSSSLNKDNMKKKK